MTWASILQSLDVAISSSWRALLQRIKPGFGIGKQLTTAIVREPGGCSVVSVSFEGSVESEQVREAIRDSKSRLRSGATLASIVYMANQLNALVGVHLVAGVDHHLVAVIPAGRLRLCQPRHAHELLGDTDDLVP